MKEYKNIVPEIIVGLGDKTEFAEKEPPFKTVTKLHTRLEDWLGDDLMLNSNCCIVTEALKKALEKTELTGFEFAEMRVTKDEYFDDNYQLNKPLPKFYWMKITGTQNVDDLFLDSIDDLYASNIFLSFLKNGFQINHLNIDPKYDKETDDFIMSLIKRDKGL
ncbi:hypothetical protein AGMMS50239_07020 [Bacteroidia bacterium]|nr:hypothetical protein AGMMS50239_07020 [Bacteroidia bacterium]